MSKRVLHLHPASALSAPCCSSPPPLRPPYADLFKCLKQGSSQRRCWVEKAVPETLWLDSFSVQLRLGPHLGWCLPATGSRAGCKVRGCFTYLLPAIPLQLLEEQEFLLLEEQAGAGGVKMPSIFAYQSAEVDWCEENFKHSEYIAEYYNTISNIPFFIFPPVMLWLNTQYTSYRSAPLRCLVIMEMLIGVFSMYFHSTLSYAGQMLDELSILWTLSMCYVLWLPSHHLPRFIKNREQFNWIVAIVTVFSTLMSFLKPALNAYVLNTFVLHFFYMMFQEVKTNHNHFPSIQRTVVMATGWWTIAIVCWIVDRFLCEFCHKINFRYLHSLWHIFILIAIHHAVTLITFCDVFYDLSCSEPKVVYWPRNFGPLALPYVVFQRSNKSY